ncbi:MAG TPA: phytoene desaturase, partial [Spirochaetaceae bacterium]|nr:phytoene desaturase [Spirochaetaceae bacterium]
NADVLSTYRRLLGQPDAPEAKRYEALEPSSSGLVFLWGIKTSFEQLSSNNIFFSADYRREFSRIFDEGLVPDDPTMYVNITSKTSPQDAPAGCENWFVLINVPRNSGQDWQALAAGAKARILSRLGRELGRDIEPLIETEQLITPADIERDTGSTYGSLYGIASNDRFSAFFRHANRSRRIRGLYFSGGSAHPGGGMPLALLSGSITAELVRKHGTH